VTEFLVFKSSAAYQHFTTTMSKDEDGKGKGKGHPRTGHEGPQGE